MSPWMIKRMPTSTFTTPTAWSKTKLLKMTYLTAVPNHFRVAFAASVIAGLAQESLPGKW